MLRRCVWSRNIKNRCSIYIYIYDISNVRVKGLQNGPFPRGSKCWSFLSLLLLYPLLYKCFHRLSLREPWNCISIVNASMHTPVPPDVEKKNCTIFPLSSVIVSNFHLLKAPPFFFYFEAIKIREGLRYLKLKPPRVSPHPTSTPKRWEFESVCRLLVLVSARSNPFSSLSPFLLHSSLRVSYCVFHLGSPACVQLSVFSPLL